MSTPADPALAALCDEAAALCADPRLATLLHTHWPALGRGGRRVGTRIHPDDQMLLHSLRHHRDAGAAVSQYFNVALQQYHAARQIVDTLFPVPSGRLELLDFACGFGRLIRFLVACDRDVEITAAEIQPDALAFVGDEFGVATVPSTMAPEAFDPGRRFDVVWVASLFSHLPEGLFHRWLSRLHALLTPRGVLCFSVHDEVLAPPGAMPASGLLFRPYSENAALDADAYGTTYVTERFVRAAIARGIGARAPVHRIARALAHEQDVYVVAADPGRDLSPLAGFRHGPWGWVDERRVDAGALVLRGWAASLDDGALPAVTIRVDGTEHRCPTGGMRPDVRDVFGDERLANTGWDFVQALPPGRAHPWVEVTAHTVRGECALLYAAWPGGRARPSSHSVPRVVDRPVEIVLPVHGSLDVVRRCVASVLDTACHQPWHLTIIDDASPGPEVGRWLREFAAIHPEVTVLANARNLGFVATVNLGLRLAGRRDVVLLNSDTEVAGDWIDRLHRAAHGAPRIGTVTPFSNNATICSFPRFCEDNPLPPGHTTATLDQLFAQTHAGQTVEIPTAVGFCMYIRRDCLDEVGEFDAQTFGAGYGEENDFCLRATARGWQHLHALDVFVYHAGATSFSERRHELQRAALEAMRRLHPGYEDLIRAFVQRDPARPYRETIERVLEGGDAAATA